MNDMRKIINLVESVEETNLFEASFSRIHKHLEDTSICIITAYRGLDDNASEEEINNQNRLNKQNNVKLKNDIRALGYGFNSMKGGYVENHGTEDARNVEEHSYFVTDNKNDPEAFKNSMIELGKKYDQDSVILKIQGRDDVYLYGTNNAEFPGLDKESSVGSWHPNKMGEFYSKMKGKSFVFENFYQRPGNVGGRWAEKLSDTKTLNGE